MQRPRAVQLADATAPDLRERVRFEERAAKDDGYGNTVTSTWRAAFPVVAAAIIPLLGGEQAQQARLASRTQVIVKVRWSAWTLGIKSDMRVVDQRTGAIYQVKADPIDPDNSRRWLDVLCESGVEA